MRKQFRDLASLTEALTVLETLAIEPTATTVPLREARGRFVGAPIRSPMDVPGFDRSIMDGYAVRAEDTIGAYDDTPVILEYNGRVRPGESPTVTVEPETAVEIATGAVIPPGANAVVMVEQTARSGDTVSIFRPVTPQEHVMAQGADIPAGSTVLRRGDHLDARRIGLLAAIGIDSVSVFEAPQIGLISTGEEIVRPTDRDTLDAGEIFDINSFSLAAAIEDAGGSPIIYPHADDSYDVIRETIETAAAECDLVVSSGSTSASTGDVIYRIVEDVGELLLHGIAVKPGKPTVFGRIDDTPILGMPGNPISALMNFRLFVAPLLRWATGREASYHQTVGATLANTVESVSGRTQLKPVGLISAGEGGLVTYSVDKGSGAITSLADADGYLTIDGAVHYLEAGTTVDVTLLDETITPPDVLLCGEPCPVLDEMLDNVDHRVRWLAVGSNDGVRKLRDGIADLAAVMRATELIDRFDLEEIDIHRGYERQVGLLHRDTVECDPSTLIASAETIAVPPATSGLHSVADALFATEEDSVTTLERPSDAGSIAAVESGVANIALVLAASARSSTLAFTSIGWEPLDIVVARSRGGKPGVDELLSAIEDIDFDHHPGVRPSDSV